MKFLRLKIILTLTTIFVGAFFCLWSTRAVETGTITVDMTVNSGGTQTGGGSPSISNVTTTNIGYTGATVQWTATDDVGIVLSSFEYGLTIPYSSIGTISGSYQTVLSNLATGTTYIYKILVKDGNNNEDTSTGSFTTLTYVPPVIDITPPVISGISVLAGMTTATISFTTDEDSYGSINYVISQSSNTSTASNSTLKKSHSFDLSGLLPNSTYYYRVLAQDSDGNSANSIYSSFLTTQDSIRPPNVTFTSLVTSTNTIIPTWVNLSTIKYPDFSGVKVLRKATTASANKDDGTVIYTGTGQTTNDTSFSYNTLYYYTIYSFDSSNNYSDGVNRSITYVSTTPVVIVTPEICGDGIDNDNNGKTDCADDVCKALPACQVTPEICGDGIDNDNNGKTDCADDVCKSLPQCQAKPSAEICNDGIDNDGDLLIDCLDADCAGFSGCIVVIIPPKDPPSGGGAEQCNDSKDNDGDGLIDYPLDPGCVSITDSDEYNPATSTVPIFAKISLKDLKFYAGNGNIELSVVNSVVTGLSGYSLTIMMPATLLLSTPSSTILKISGSSYQMNLLNGSYQTKITFPSLKTVDAYVEIDYGATQFDSINFKIKGIALGDIFGEDNKRVDKVKVNLYNENDQLVNIGIYEQTNPYTSNANGIYGFMVPNGKYYLKIENTDYYEKKTSIMDVKNNIINEKINLVKIPKKIEEVIDSNAKLATNIINVTKNIGEKAVASVRVTVNRATVVFQDMTKVVQEVADNPVVEKAAERIVAPASIGVVAVSVIPFLSLSNLLPFLRLLFLQPLMLLGWNRKRRWGLIYNALNKIPIDLAIVRLIDANTGRLLQSKVTDREGRYYFIANPGKYRIEVKKDKFTFPSLLLKNEIVDGRKRDIYHGELLEVTDEKAALTANIPLDPAGELKKPTRLIWSKIGRGIQNFISITGILLTTASLYISPKWYIAVLLVVHILLFFVFRRMSSRVDNKSWGIIYDENTKKPIGRVIARLFNTRFNKLVATQITDRKGRYQFLAGDDEYHVTYEHKEYKPKQTTINLKGREPDAIADDIPLDEK